MNCLNGIYSSDPSAIPFVFPVTVYSNSRLDKFEECPRGYKFKYVERVEVEKRRNVYGFLGAMVHKTLEQFHEDMEKNEKRSLKGVVKLFLELWGEHWTENIQNPHPDYTPKHFKETGKKCVENYYEKHTPFDKEKTLATELRVHPTIKANGAEYKFQGLLDRLSKNKQNHYIIHDYKTGKNLPNREDLETNRQLPLYQIGVQQKYPDAAKVKLVWHYLRYGKSFKIKFDEEELNKIQNNTVDLIRKVEKAEEKDHFPTMRHNGANCNWCDYQELCPAWKNTLREDSKPNLTQKGLDDYL